MYERMLSRRKACSQHLHRYWLYRIPDFGRYVAHPHTLYCEASLNEHSASTIPPLPDVHCHDSESTVHSRDGENAAMFNTSSISHVPLQGRAFDASIPVDRPSPPCLETLLCGVSIQRRRIQRKQPLFRTGQRCYALYLIHAGFFKTCVLSEDGREKITGFHLRGDLLGCDAFGLPNYSCDAIALDICEVWELPIVLLQARTLELMPYLTAHLAMEIRRDWHWMLAVGTLAAEQRVAAFLLDLAGRLETLGFSARHLPLRMTRAELGNFLALQLETVTRALSKLAAAGFIVVDGREIRIENAVALRHMLGLY